MGSRRTGGGVENVYAAAEKWVDCALRKGDSLFTPGTPIWTSQLLGELRERFLDRPDEGSGSFYEKLRVQLEDSPPEAYQLMGEVLYVHFLIVWTGAMARDLKERQIKSVLDWSTNQVEIPDELAVGLAPGMIDARPGFNTLRPFQVGFIIEAVEQLKEQEPDKRELLLSNPWAFKEFLTNLEFRSKLIKDRPNSPGAQRESLLHLVFPNTFEAILAGGKKTIAEAQAFSHFITDQTTGVDHKLAQIRNGLEVELRRDFDFYDSDIQVRWGTNFNPWSDFVRRAQEYVHSGQLESQEIDYKLEIGEDLAAARNAVLTNAANWHDLLQDALKPTSTWRTLGISQSNIRAFKRWCSDHLEEALESLQILWVEGDLPASKRLSAFSEKLPDSAFGGKVGARLNVSSVLLMGLDAEQYPPVRLEKFKDVYTRTAYDQPERDANEAELYEHALGFLDRFIEEAGQRGLDLRHRLDAQSLVWAIQRLHRRRWR